MTSVNGVESVATILERESASTIEDWCKRADLDASLVSVHLERNERCSHLTAVLRDLVQRLRHPLPLGTHALVSTAASEHGRMRRKQGYTAAMLVQESRMLQVSIFQTLQNNLQSVNFSQLLLDVMAIADEVDSQLGQAMTSYIAEGNLDSLCSGQGKCHDFPTGHAVSHPCTRPRRRSISLSSPASYVRYATLCSDN